MTTDDQVEKWAKEFMKTGIWMAEESDDGLETIIEGGLGKYKVPKPLAECTKEDVHKALAPEIVAEKWKGHGHAHDAHGNDIHDDGTLMAVQGEGHEGEGGHGHEDHGHGHGHEGHGHGHDEGHGHGHDEAKGHGGYGGHAHEAHSGGDCCDDHGKGGHGHEAHGEGHGHAHGHAHGHKDGEESAKIVAVGVVKLAGETYSVDREGQCEGGKACEFGVERVSKWSMLQVQVAHAQGTASGTDSGFEAWVENAAGERVSDLVKAEAHGAHWHFMVTPQAGAQASKFALRLGEAVDKVDIHPGAAPCNDGISSPLLDKSGTIVGFVELKLHDDAGDLEIWICKDGAMTQPLDLDPGTMIEACFLACGPKGRDVDLKVRNNDQNEDEDQKANMRNGKTNYFIFPGETGKDPSWLQGEKFRSMVVVTVHQNCGGRLPPYETSPFTIVGHSQY